MNHQKTEHCIVDSEAERASKPLVGYLGALKSISRDNKNDPVPDTSETVDMLDAFLAGHLTQDSDSAMVVTAKQVTTAIVTSAASDKDFIPKDVKNPTEEQIDRFASLLETLFEKNTAPHKTYMSKEELTTLKQTVSENVREFLLDEHLIVPGNTTTDTTTLKNGYTIHVKKTEFLKTVDMSVTVSDSRDVKLLSIEGKEEICEFLCSLQAVFGKSCEA